eukprot:5041159-Alexandrium_andersonii.AAC.1
MAQNETHKSSEGQCCASFELAVTTTIVTTILWLRQWQASITTVMIVVSKCEASLDFEAWSTDL